MLNTSAIPFNYPDDDRSIAARRYANKLYFCLRIFLGLNQLNQPKSANNQPKSNLFSELIEFFFFRCRSRRFRRQFETEHSNQSPEQRMLLETVFDEAVTAFQSVLEPARQQPPRPEVAEKATQIRQPPNSPDTVANSNIVTFDFEPINDSDGFESDVPAARSLEVNPRSSEVTVAKAEVTEVTTTSTGIQRQSLRRRSLRKRPRKSSFKTLQAPRVAPKFSCFEADADDEASSSGDENNSDIVDSAAAALDQIDLIKARIPRALCITDDDSSSSEEIFADNSGLQLKLAVLSEAQKVTASVVTDWAKVGAELRSIADKFGGDDDLHGHLQGQDEPDANGGRVVARHEVDVVSLINLMLPFSVPQSLWSALVSYAAWKIFKRFQ